MLTEDRETQEKYCDSAHISVATYIATPQAE